LPDPNVTQARVADPTLSVWVEASAGTGKTKSLTDRLLRLLLSGARPDGLLCLTYTRAAAAEMANRLQRRLAEWMTADDRELRCDLAKLLGPDLPDDAEGLTAQARQLFVAVGGLPGGLRIQTIHSYCQSILSRFPLESGLPNGSQVLEEGQRDRLLRLARDRVLEWATAKSDPSPVVDGLTPTQLRRATALLVAILDDGALADALGEMLTHRAALTGLIRRRGLVPLLADYGVTPETLGEQPDLCATLAEGLTEARIADLRHLAAILASGKNKGDRDRSAAMARCLEHPVDSWPQDPGLIDAWRDVFLTKTGEPRKTGVGKALVQANPEIEEILFRETERLVAVSLEHLDHRAKAVTAALLALGAAILSTYEDLKRQRLALDYDDLIALAAELFARPTGVPNSEN